MQTNIKFYDLPYKTGTRLLAFTLCFFIWQTAYAAPGDFDPTFSGDGKLMDFFPGNGNDFPFKAAVQTDGKIVVVGESDYLFDRVCSIARFNTDGSLDATFGDGGKRLLPLTITGFTDSCRAVAVQTDGKIIVGGAIFPEDDFEQGDFYLRRLNQNGSLDTSFGEAGGVRTSLTDLSDSIGDIVIQPDGRIVAAGYGNGVSQGSSNPARSVFAVVRYNSDGSLDTTFDSDGKVTTIIGSGNSVAESVVLQPDGKIVAGGTTDRFSVTLEGRFAVVRYNQNGSLDTAFDTDGIVTTQIVGRDNLNDLALQPDGKIVAAGSYFGDSTSFNFVLVRYNQNGSLDNTFGGSGIVTTILSGGGDGAGAVVVQPDGKIIAAGYRFQSNAQDSVFIRYNANGSLDTSFGTNGVVIHFNPVPGNSNQFFSGGYNDAILQPDGKIVGMTQYYVGKDLDFALLRYNSNGTLDPTFDGDGIAYAGIGTGSTVGNSVVHQPDGKIIVVGYTGSFGTSFLAARYNANGTPDASFGTAGKVTTAISPTFDYANAVAVQPDGKIVVAGESRTAANQGLLAIVRYNANGSLDTSFDTDGILTTTTEVSGGAKDVVIQPDGKIVAVGSVTLPNSNSDFIVFRFNANGSPDTTFGGAGSVMTSFTSSFDRASSLALQPDGKIVAAGSSNAGSSSAFNYDFALARYNADGSPDTSFDTDGKMTAQISSGNDEVYDAALQPDGKIVLAGSAETGTTGDFDLTYNFALARFNPNGSLDASFDADGKVMTAILGGADELAIAYSVAVQTDGKIIAAGSAYNDSSDTGFTLVRYNQNGSLDASYGVGGKSILNFGITPYGLALDNVGRAVAVGDDNSGLMAIARILGDGTPATAGRTPFDFDGDGRADLSIFRPSETNWYVSGSRSGFSGIKWGLSSDRLAPADYDGDGKTDVAVWRESEGNFYVINSATLTVRVENFGLAGDILTVGDWDGDGKAEPSVYRNGAQSYFYYRGSLNNPNGDITYVPWGTSGDKPVRGDFDGDGKQDAAVFRSSNNTWYIRNSSNGSIRYDNWGISTDKFVCADYDGDSKTDLAVFRDGVWYIKRSSTNTPVYETFGLSTDAPVPADYDGDGRADVAVFRDGIWYLKQSTSGFAAAQFGLSGDRSVPNAYVNP